MSPPVHTLFVVESVYLGVCVSERVKQREGGREKEGS